MVSASERKIEKKKETKNFQGYGKAGGGGGRHNVAHVAHNEARSARLTPKF
jgi:hypothetical protein